MILGSDSYEKRKENLWWLKRSSGGRCRCKWWSFDRSEGNIEISGSLVVL